MAVISRGKMDWTHWHIIGSQSWFRRNDEVHKHCTAMCTRESSWSADNVRSCCHAKQQDHGPGWAQAPSIFQSNQGRKRRCVRCCSTKQYQWHDHICYNWKIGFFFFVLFVLCLVSTETMCRTSRWWSPCVLQELQRVIKSVHDWAQLLPPNGEE